MLNGLAADAEARVLKLQMERDAAKRASVKAVKDGDKHVGQQLDEDVGLDELVSDVNAKNIEHQEEGDKREGHEVACSIPRDADADADA